MLVQLPQLISKHDVLTGSHVQLEPLSAQHRAGLRQAADYEQIWHYMPYNATKDLFDPWFNKCLDIMGSGEQFIYVVRSKRCNSILGATAFYDLELENKRLSLGYSWYSPNVWGSAVNPESKLLMLTLAFEGCSFNRVELGADSRNRHSCNAIKKLGATEEGVLRQHMILHDGAVTDTVVFSILASEWHVIKNRLIKRVQSIYAGR